MSTAVASVPAVLSQPISKAKFVRAGASVGGDRAFEPFGELRGEVSIAREGSLWRLAYWIANHRDAGQSPRQLWRAAQQANPGCFKTYTVIRLDRPSFFLPAGEVVFAAAKNPSQIPQDPPQGVLLRHSEAIAAFPNAAFYFLEPVFTKSPCLRLLTAPELRDESAGDQRDAFWLAQNYGTLFRTHRWFCRQRERVTETIDRWIEEVEESRQRRIEFRARAATLTVEYATIDPVLCFELPSQPGRLWFEAHWYDGADGRRYVHF